MKNIKILLWAILLLLIAQSCSTKHKVTNRERLKQLELKQNDISEFIDTYKIKQSEISVFNEALIIEPIDNTKPYTIGSQTFDNVKITTTKDNVTTSTLEIDSTKTQKQDKTQTKKETISKKRSSDSEAIRQSVWVWLAIALCGIAFIYFKFK